MGSIVYDIKFQQNDGLLVSPSFLIDNCLYGVQLCTSDGRTLSYDTMKNYILAAQAEVERYLDLKLNHEIIEERKDFYLEDWKAWGYVRCTYPINKAFALDGWVNTIRQVQYPKEWLSSRKTSDGRLFQRNLYIVPVGSAVANFQSIVFSGITPHLGFLNMAHIPNYWNITYGTGFDKMPEDIIKAIMYLAAIPMYMWLGNAILPYPGLNSYSISIDGLSQSRATDAGGYKTRIDQLKQDLYGGGGVPGLLNSLQQYYNTLNLTVC